MRDLQELVGNTPILEVEENILFKLEYINPSGSHKDRMALSMLLDLIDRKGEDGAIVEATSGSTGVALSLYGNLMRFNVYITAKEETSPVKISLMRKLGSNVMLCPDVPPDDPRSIHSVAKRIAKEKGAYFLEQDSNPANPKGQETMADEIMKQVKHVDIFVMGVGTGGTVTGVARKLKKEFGTRIIAVTPEGSALAKKFGLSGEFKGDIEGYGAFDIPENLDLSLVDEVYAVSPQEAMNWTSKLVSKGVLGGMSSGAHYKAARYAREKYGGTVITVAADHVLFHPRLLG